MATKIMASVCVYDKDGEKKTETLIVVIGFYCKLHFYRQSEDLNK